jgi:hypothetical protein
MNFCRAVDVSVQFDRRGEPHCVSYQRVACNDAFKGKGQAGKSLALRDIPCSSCCREINWSQRVVEAVRPPTSHVNMLPNRVI